MPYSIPVCKLSGLSCFSPFKRILSSLLTSLGVLLVLACRGGIYAALCRLAADTPDWDHLLL